MKRKLKQISEEIYNDRRVPFAVMWGEILEVFEELLAGKISAALVEIQQCVYYAQLLFHQRTGINFRPRGVDAVVEDFYARLGVWKEIFQRENLQFSVDYLAGGSNYNRPHKVEAALRLARTDQEHSLARQSVGVQ